MSMDLNARSAQLPDNTGEDLMALVDATVDRTIATLDPARMRPDEMVATAMGHVIKLAILGAQQRIVRLPGSSAVAAVTMTAEVAGYHAGQALEALPPALNARHLAQVVVAATKGARDNCQCPRCQAKRASGRPH